MLPPPGLEPSAILENATPTLVAASKSFLNLGIDIPSATSTAAAIVIATAGAIVNAHTSSSNHGQPPPSHGGDKAPDNGECQLLGPFAILVQGALGLLALLSLVYKRWRERPQRPLKIWFFDASKQVFGSVLVHIANLLMSLLSSGQLNVMANATSVVTRGVGPLDVGGLAQRDVDAQGKYKPNPCSFYLLNLAIDTTIGIPILIVLLRILTALFALTPLGNPRESIESGHYGSPPRATWWLKQSIIYFIGLMGMKICVLIIFLVLPWISRVGDWALRWTEGDEVLQVVFVMLVFPVIMNATQYYIIDSFIKNQKTEGGHERIPDSEEDADSLDHQRSSTPYEDPPSGSSDEINSDEDSEILAKAKEKKHGSNDGKAGGRRGSRLEGLKTAGRDYDPAFDGESSPTTVVGSASTADPLLRKLDDEPVKK